MAVSFFFLVLCTYLGWRTFSCDLSLADNITDANLALLYDGSIPRILSSAFDTFILHCISAEVSSGDWITTCCVHRGAQEDSGGPNFHTI